MKIIEVSFRRTFNLGNYESATVELKATINEGEDAKQAFNQLVDDVIAWRKAGKVGAK